MPVIHSNLTFLGKRIRGLIAAVNGDEPLRKAEAGAGGPGGGGLYLKGAAWSGSGIAISALLADVVYGVAQSDGEITSNTMLGGGGPGSATVEVWKVDYAGALPTSGNKISGSAPGTISSASKSKDVALTGWTTSVVAGDIFAFKLLTSTNFTWLSFTMEITP